MVNLMQHSKSEKTQQSISLKEYLEETGIKHHVFAKKAGVCNATLSSLVSRSKDPHLSVCLKIEKATDGKVTCRDMQKIDNKKL